MSYHLKLLLIVFIPFLNFGQSQINKSISWEAIMLGEYIPALYSDWNTSALGGQINFQYQLENDFFTSLSGEIFFIPSSANNNFDYTSLRSISTSLSYQHQHLTKLNSIMTMGLSYTRGKIASQNKDYPGVFAQIKAQYRLSEKIDLFINIGSMYDFSNQNITPSFKAGFKAGFIIISFDVAQYIAWGNHESRLNNILSIPHITNHSF